MIGTSTGGNVGTTSAVLVPKGTFAGGFTIKNTHASQILYLSHNPVCTTSDFPLAAGTSLAFPYSSSALTGLGSGATTTWAAIGM